MNEQTIQIRLASYCWRFSQPVSLPNSSVLGWESDMIGVTKAGIMHEYEIKLTVADFKADMKKDKHRDIVDWLGGMRERVWEEHGRVWPNIKHKARKPANYFWYVVPKELAEKIVVPQYAGLLVVQTDGAILQEVKAPRLHKEKISEKELWQMIGSACGRFWSARRILVNRGIPFTEHEID